MQELLNKIERLLAKFQDPEFLSDKEEIRGWREKIANAILIDGIKDHEGIKMLTRELSEQIVMINDILLEADSKKINDIQRDRMLDRKSIYKELLSMLLIDKKEIQDIETKVKENEHYLEE
jgi:hypothetical protein